MTHLYLMSSVPNPFLNVVASVTNNACQETQVFMLDAKFTCKFYFIIQTVIKRRDGIVGRESKVQRESVRISTVDLNIFIEILNAFSVLT